MRLMMVLILLHAHREATHLLPFSVMQFVDLAASVVTVRGQYTVWKMI